MLLETLDIPHNDVVIYSENKFDFKDNFKIVFKRADVKRPQKIDYFEVCKFLRDPAPKNLIVYRMLTNMNQLDAFSTRFGYFINTENKLELIYFDPIFALKDLANLKINIVPSEFRFKIQQVGYRSIGTKNNESIYSEVYTFDLRAIEAQNQNDKIFSQAIFALDDSFVEENEDYSSPTNSEEIIEVNSDDKCQFNNAKILTNSNTNDANTYKIEKLKQSFASDWESNFDAYSAFRSDKEKNREKKATSTFSEFIERQKTIETDLDSGGFFGDKSTFNNSSREPVVLRFKD
ncbi:MAG: hypothetical protein CVV23_09440 [Ignavibacteriae bacterium HGW-Ignavibacteriae-2]|jgi:hypothetical protein|nr:hypothetical protein [Bacteroidota bacterium]PKL88571.1 MAG: hypothetical protein CVV23_09440 [Ignavibacteriae bacterium HGW-Ignavibacteriae-2]